MHKNSSNLGWGSLKKTEQKSDKTAFLAEAKKRRETRESQKTEQKGVIKIQAFYRGAKERERFFKGFELDIDKKLNDMSALQKMMSLPKFQAILAKV